LGSLESVPPEKEEEVLTGSLKQEEKIIFEVLTRQPRSVDEIGRQTGMESGILLATLLSLELEGWVRQYPGKCFARAL
ncbi:MAG: hypothetical protein Q7S00_05000, partial [bacterium]|nr:hypothetical protein [bacterium]